MSVENPTSVHKQTGRKSCISFSINLKDMHPIVPDEIFVNIITSDSCDSCRNLDQPCTRTNTAGDGSQNDESQNRAQDSQSDERRNTPSCHHIKVTMVPRKLGNRTGNRVTVDNRRGERRLLNPNDQLQEGTLPTQRNAGEVAQNSSHFANHGGQEVHDQNARAHPEIQPAAQIETQLVPQPEIQPVPPSEIQPVSQSEIQPAPQAEIQPVIRPQPHSEPGPNNPNNPPQERRRGPGRPKGSKNKPKDAPDPQTPRRGPGRPKGSKNKPKDPNTPREPATPGRGRARPSSTVGSSGQGGHANTSANHARIATANQNAGNQQLSMQNLPLPDAQDNVQYGDQVAYDAGHLAMPQTGNVQRVNIPGGLAIDAEENGNDLAAQGSLAEGLQSNAMLHGSFDPGEASLPPSLQGAEALLNNARGQELGPEWSDFLPDLGADAPTAEDLQFDFTPDGNNS